MIIGFEYPQKSLFLGAIKLPKKILAKIFLPKKSRNQKFQTPKIQSSFPSVWTCVNQSTRQLVLEATTLVTRVRKVVLAGSPVMLAVGLENDRQNSSNLVAKTRMGVRLSRTPMQKQSLLHWREGDRVFCGWSGGGLQHEGQLTTIFSWTQRWYYQVCKV